MKALQGQGLDKFGISLIRPHNSFASTVARFDDKRNLGNGSQTVDPQVN